MTDRQKSNLLQIFKCLLLEIAVVAVVLVGKFVDYEQLRTVICIILSVTCILWLFTQKDMGGFFARIIGGTIGGTLLGMLLCFPLKSHKGRLIVLIVGSLIACIPMIVYLFKLRKNTDEKIAELEEMKKENSSIEK